MSKRIVLFNHKGGVSKTTSVYNIGWVLSKKYRLELCRAGTDKTRFMQYKFTNCMICSCSTTADGGFPMDDVAFTYGKIEWCYTQQNRRGGYAAGNVAGGWSLEKNCKV